MPTYSLNPESELKEEFDEKPKGELIQYS